MGLASVCVRRPVTASMFYLGTFLLGAISWTLTPRELFPSVSFPQLLVVTRYGNAAPEEIENLITKVIEESVGTVPNLKRVKSLSKEGVSLVTLEFDWGVDMGFAHLSAREKIDQIKDRLPSEAEEPIINRINPFAQPMMIFSVSGDMHMARLTEVTKKVVKQRLEKVSGVASANISGGLEREIQVLVDRGRIEASNLSLSQVVDALKDTNLNYPGGTVQGKFYEYLLRTMGEFKNLSEIGKTIVKVDKPEEEDRDREERRRTARRTNEVRSERLLSLESVAEVVDAFKDKTSYSRHNGQDNVSISLQKQADANTITTANRVREALDELRASLPRGMQLDLVYDESVFIERAVGGVTQDGVTGGVLAFLVLYYFLKSFSMAVIVAMAIPASTLFTFTGMFFNGISINMLSLAGLGLGIGNMVDNSIVVAENIARHRDEMSKSTIDAAIDGTEEVAASMVTSSLTNVAVLLPLLFARGVAQLIFRDMFFIVTCASFASVFISITLVPLLTGHPLPIGKLWNRLRGLPAVPEVAPADAAAPAEGEGKLKRLYRSFLSGLSDEALQNLIDRYQRALAWVIVNPRKTWMTVAASMVVSFFMLTFQDKVFMPKFDQGQFMLRVQMPVGTRLDVTDRVSRSVERVLKGIDGVQDITSNVGSTNVESVDALGAHQAQLLVNVDREKGVSSEAVIAKLRAALDRENLEGAEIQYILQDSILASVFETAAPIVVEVKGPDLITLRKLSEDIGRELGGVAGVYGVKSSLALPSAETRVDIDKVRASAYGLSVAEIARTALIGVKGFIATNYKEAGEEVGVRVQLRQEDRVDVAAIQHLAVRAPSGVMVPLSDVAELHMARGPSEIRHMDQQRSVLVSANVQDRSTSEVIEEVSAMLTPFQGLADYQVVLSGESQQMKESFGGLVVAMALAVLLIYMIMAAEFESLWNPLIIMITIPFSLVGVALSLFLTGTPLSAPVFLGTILLAGSVVNYGIVLIDFMKQLKEEGHDLWTTVIHGCSTRLRPILMSSLTTILAVLPLALGLSEGSELSSPMAVVTFGGLAISVLLSLFIIPLIYYTSEEWLAKRQGPAAQE
jgi:hydrophobic/amphiphilic exporter-1 (mainly G- bacteria), HAE1 family